jgi:hypothetical protein
MIITLPPLITFSRLHSFVRTRARERGGIWLIILEVIGVIVVVAVAVWIALEAISFILSLRDRIQRQQDRAEFEEEAQEWEHTPEPAGVAGAARGIPFKVQPGDSY